VAGFCEGCDETSAFINGGISFDWLAEYYVLKKVLLRLLLKILRVFLFVDKDPAAEATDAPQP
jgi:hypothetical protein